MSVNVATETPLDFGELESELASAAIPKLSEAERRLVLVKALYACAASIASVFLNLYLFQLGGFAALVKYCLAEMVMLSVMFVVAGNLLRRHRSVRLLQAGAIGGASVYLALLLLGPEAGRFVLILGAMTGIAEGFYWTSINLTEYVATSGSTRSIYYGRSAYWSGIVSVVGPPMAGLSVVLFHGDGASPTGYYVLFGVLLLVLVSVAFVARKMVSCSDLRFRPNQIGSGLQSRRWRWALLQQFFGGMWGLSIPAIAPVLVFLSVHGELTVGLLSAGSAITGAIGARVAARLLHHRPDLYVVGSICIPLSFLGFATGSGWFAVFCLSFALQAVNPFSNIPATRAAYDVLEAENIHWQDSFHRIVETEFALNAGRTIGFVAILAVVGGASDLENVRNTIVAAAVIPLLAGLVQARLNRLTRGSNDRTKLGGTQ